MTRTEIIAAAREIVAMTGNHNIAWDDLVHSHADSICRELIRLHDGGTWSNTPPTEPGWYWYKEKDNYNPWLRQVDWCPTNPGKQLQCSSGYNFTGFWLRAEPADAATLAELRAENCRLQDGVDELDETIDEWHSALSRAEKAESELTAAKAEVERLKKIVVLDKR